MDRLLEDFGSEKKMRVFEYGETGERVAKRIGRRSWVDGKQEAGEEREGL